MIVYALNKSCLRLIWHIKASVKQIPSNVHHYLLFYHSHQLFSTEKSTQASLPECCQSSSCYTTLSAGIAQKSELLNLRSAGASRLEARQCLTNRISAYVTVSF